MSENDYIAEYVKERCPEVIQTIDYSLWRVSKQTFEVRKEQNDSSNMDNSDM